MKGTIDGIEYVLTDQKDFTIYYVAFDPDVYAAYDILQNQENIVEHILYNETWCGALNKELDSPGYNFLTGSFDVITTTLDSVSDITEYNEFSVKESDIYSGLLLAALSDFTQKSCFNIIYENMDPSLELFDDTTKQINNAGFLKKYGIIADFVSNALEMGKTVEDAYNTYFMYYNLYLMSNEMKGFLREMAETPSANVYVREAAKNCLSIIENEWDEFMNKLDDMKIDEKYLFDKVVESAWDFVSDTIMTIKPEIGFFYLAYSGERIVLEQALGTSRTVEQYYRIKAMDALISSARAAALNAKDTFIQSPTPETARKFITSLQFVSSMLDEDCDTALDYYEILEEASLTTLVKAIAGTSIDKYKKSIEWKKVTIGDDRNLIQTHWIERLGEEFPDSGLKEFYSSLK